MLGTDGAVTGGVVRLVPHQSPAETPEKISFRQARPTA
jgi:hypothetical protein